MNQSLRRMEYAVRGEVVNRAEQIQKELKSRDHTYPFDEIIFTNIGNPQALGQKPMTFFRQVLALTDLPPASGVDHPDVAKLFPADAIARAKELHTMMGGMGTGAYTGSQGVAGICNQVADYITARDNGHVSDPSNIFLTNGASAGIQMVLTAAIASSDDAVMMPIPQYPIYSALTELLGAKQVGYALDEANGWSVTAETLRSQHAKATADGVTKVKALVVINPGNPTGQIIDRDVLLDICHFCADEGIVLLADEVYQRNVYTDATPFVSTKEVVCDNNVENLALASFHSTSKGLIGECGRRGGYMELHGFNPEVQAEILKLASSGLCSGVAGQVMTSLMVRPPAVGDESYESHEAEEAAIFSSLQRRSRMLIDGLNAIDGINCTDTYGAMYVFPEIDMPAKAVEHAAAEGTTVDSVYAISLLNRTGICVVPASGFGQAQGRAGFRTTFLPNEGQMKDAIGLFELHHNEFWSKWG